MPALQRERVKGELVRRAPAERVEAEPWSFVLLALGLGVTAGLLWRYKGFRKALGFYLMARRFI